MISQLLLGGGKQSGLKSIKASISIDINTKLHQSQLYPHVIYKTKLKVRNANDTNHHHHLTHIHTHAHAHAQIQAIFHVFQDRKSIKINEDIRSGVVKKVSWFPKILKNYTSQDIRLGVYLKCNVGYMMRFEDLFLTKNLLVNMKKKE